MTNPTAAASNYFETMADVQMVGAAKAKARQLEKRMAKSDAEAPMKLSPLDQKLFDAQQQLRNYHRLKRQEMVALRNGPYGQHVKELEQLLDTLAMESAPALVGYIAKCIWLRSAPPDIKHQVLGIISATIARLRVRAGLPPFDDSLPFTDEPPTAYEQIRHTISNVGVQP